MDFNAILELFQNGGAIQRAIVRVDGFLQKLGPVLLLTHKIVCGIRDVLALYISFMDSNE